MSPDIMSRAQDTHANIDLSSQWEKCSNNSQEFKDTTGNQAESTGLTYGAQKDPTAEQRTGNGLNGNDSLLTLCRYATWSSCRTLGKGTGAVFDYVLLNLIIEY